MIIYFKVDLHEDLLHNSGKKYDELILAIIQVKQKITNNTFFLSMPKFIFLVKNKYKYNITIAIFKKDMLVLFIGIKIDIKDIINLLRFKYFSNTFSP